MKHRLASVFLAALNPGVFDDPPCLVQGVWLPPERVPKNLGPVTRNAQKMLEAPTGAWRAMISEMLRHVGPPGSGRLLYARIGKSPSISPARRPLQRIAAQGRGGTMQAAAVLVVGGIGHSDPTDACSGQTVERAVVAPSGIIILPGDTASEFTIHGSSPGSVSI
jgi:hypothetical protein